MTETNKNQELRVLLTEDDIHWQAIIEEVVEDLGGTLVLTVETLEDAMAAITKMEELKINLAILGGNLGEFKMGNTDSVAILKAMKEQGVTAKTIGLSADLFSSVDVDVDLGKWNTAELAPTIIKLLALDVEESEEAVE